MQIYGAHFYEVSIVDRTNTMDELNKFRHFVDMSVWKGMNLYIYSIYYIDYRIVYSFTKDSFFLFSITIQYIYFAFLFVSVSFSASFTP